MSWFQKILPPKIKRRVEARKSMPEGLWSKCPACNEVLYRADLESNLEVCPKCGHHHRIGARARLAMLLDAEGQHEIAFMNPSAGDGVAGLQGFQAELLHLRLRPAHRRADSAPGVSLR